MLWLYFKSPRAPADSFNSYLLQLKGQTKVKTHVLVGSTRQHLVRYFSSTQEFLKTNVELSEPFLGSNLSQVSQGTKLCFLLELYSLGCIVEKREVMVSCITVLCQHFKNHRII